MKSRLTITLPNTLLHQIDSMVDKQSIRNRSHAIEQLIRQSLSPHVTTVFILAGGKTKEIAKPLLEEIQGEKLIYILMKKFQQYGIKQVVFCLSPDYTEVEELCGDGKALGIQLTYSYETKPLGTAGALKQAAKNLDNTSPFLVLHGDILTDIKLDEVFEFHLQEAALATMVVKPQLGRQQYGEVYIQGNHITTFSETGTDSGIKIINTGVYVLQPEVLKAIPVGKETYLESDVFPYLAKKNQLRAFFFQGLWHDISTKDQYKEANLNWSKR